MSLMLLEPTTRELETLAAQQRVRDELQHHLAEVADLCEQVRASRDEEADAESRELFDELVQTMEAHHAQIAEQLADLEHADLYETATYAR